MEGPGQAVRAGLPAFGDGGPWAPVRRIDGQAVEEITNDHELFEQIGLLWIKGGRVGAEAIGEAGLASRAGRAAGLGLATCQEDKACDQTEAGQSGHGLSVPLCADLVQTCGVAYCCVVAA